MTYHYQNPPYAFIYCEDAKEGQALERSLVSLHIKSVLLNNREDIILLTTRQKAQIIFIDYGCKVHSDIFEIIAQIKKNVGPDVPIIVLCDEQDVYDLVALNKAGVCDILVKSKYREILKNKMAFHLKDNFILNVKNQFKLPSIGDLNVNIEFNSSLESIDEFGLRFSADHLLAKGSAIRLTFETFYEIFKKNTIALTVMSVSFEHHSQKYIYYAEYLEINKEEIASIRIWIAKQQDQIEALK